MPLRAGDFHPNAKIPKRLKPDDIYVSKPLGITLGRSIGGHWSYLFRVNEDRPKNKKMTDKKITIRMQREFPGRKTKMFKEVCRARRLYNNGTFSMETPPKKRSNKYDENGDVIITNPKLRNNVSP